jgi:hypothetical protein
MFQTDPLRALLSNLDGHLGVAGWRLRTAVRGKMSCAGWREVAVKMAGRPSRDRRARSGAGGRRRNCVDCRSRFAPEACAKSAVLQGAPNLVDAAAFTRYMLASSYPAVTAQPCRGDRPSWPPPGVRCECQKCHVHTFAVAWPDAFACCHNCASRALAPVLS